MQTLLIVLAAFIVAAFLLFRFNSLWIYRFWDRATRNSTGPIDRSYEVPRYFVRKADGSVDVELKWPGWDGWYFFMLPDKGSGCPADMIRSSLMTGLYGLDGIDNYDRLMLRLSTFEAVEFLSLIPTNGAQKFNNLSQHYLPRRWHLLMNPDALDIAITGQQLEHDESFEEYGRVSGTWPNYRFKSINPESGIRVELSFTAQNTIWWADAPGLFTYFAIFGTYTGTVNGSPVTGHGAFEHGFARKMFDADGVFLPIRLANRIAPSFRPIRYHYELFIGDQAERGGFMHASAFRIPVRDRGGVFRDGVHVPIDGVKITYLMDPPPDLAAAHCPARPPVTFYRSWRVEARTPRGTLTYTARRDWPPASIATNMMYYNFTYSGDFAGEPIAGRGYGEYVHI